MNYFHKLEKLTGIKLGVNYLQQVSSGKLIELAGQFIAASSNSGGDTYSIHCMYIVDPECEVNDILSRNLIFKGRIPESSIVIGCDPFGNQFLLDCSGGIRFWDHEFNANSIGDCEFLASNFDLFVDKLYLVSANDLSEIDEILSKDDVCALKLLIADGFSPSLFDKNGRNLLERAAIKNSLNIVDFLIEFKTPLRQALYLAKKNYKYFTKYKDVVNKLENYEKII